MSANPGQEPTQEEIEAYLQQLRQAPVRDIVLQAFSALGTGAEVKLGQPDARVLIDAMEALVKVTGPSLGDVEPQLTQAVGQLKMAHVQASKRGDEAGEPQAAAQPGSPGPAATPPPAASPPPAQETKQTDKLWIPGRDG